MLLLANKQRNHTWNFVYRWRKSNALREKVDKLHLGCVLRQVLQEENLVRREVLVWHLDGRTLDGRSSSSTFVYIVNNRRRQINRRIRPRWDTKEKCSLSLAALYFALSLTLWGLCHRAFSEGWVLLGLAKNSAQHNTLRRGLAFMR